MFRNLALTLGASVALCSAAAFLAGAHGTSSPASVSTASTSHLTVLVASHTMHRSGYVVASS